jgi:hypothetical protein
MKKILIAASVVGAAAAGVMLYVKNKNAGKPNDPKNALNDAYDTMDKHLQHVERKTEGLLS